jgi:ubiquinone/menaquinone biosynthesis C-methylase UbiE
LFARFIVRGRLRFRVLPFTEACMGNRHSKRGDASRRYHDRVARQYDAIYDDAYWEFHDRVTWLGVKPWLPRDTSALCCDLGCGTGKWGLKLLKSGFATTFVDHSAAMIGQVREKLETMGARGRKGTGIVGDIVDLSAIESERFELIVAMGDPISICSDAGRAAREMRRICKPGGVVIATADNKLAAVEHYLSRGDVEGLGDFLKSGKTRWLTEDDREQFELTTFTPGELRGVFERAGFEVIKVVGKTVLPVREFKGILEREGAGEKLVEMEVELAKDETAAARAGHLQITARRRVE